MESGQGSTQIGISEDCYRLRDCCCVISYPIGLEQYQAFIFAHRSASWSGLCAGGWSQPTVESAMWLDGAQEYALSDDFPVGSGL